MNDLNILCVFKKLQTVTFLLVLVCQLSCGQTQKNIPKNNPKDNVTNGMYTESEMKQSDTSMIPISMVRKVRRASNGDVLVASYLGVFRYDGKSFTNLTSKIISPRVASFWDVLEDRKGDLWFASRDSGVYHYNGKSFQQYTTKDGLATNMALHIYEDKAGNIWFGSSRYDGKSFRNYSMKDGFPSNNIRLLFEDKTGKLWFGAQGENLFVYDGQTYTVLKNKDGKTFKNVWSIIEDRNGSIWFGDVQGLWRYDGISFTRVSQRGAYAIIQDKKGNIWTTGSVNPHSDAAWALTRYDHRTLYNNNPVITEIMTDQPGLLGLLEADDGSIWFGSYEGVYRYDGKTITDFKSNNAR